MTSIRALCSGYGGLELAVEQVTGGTVVDHAEIDMAAAKVHDTHWPGIPNLGDITTVNWKEVRKMDARRNDELAQLMYDRYCQSLSVAKVADEFGRSRQSVWKMFSRRGWDLRPRPPARPSVEWRGRTFSLRDTGYYAATDGEREQLHRLVYEHHNGPLPSDHDVHHKDHDKTNNEPSNLQAMTKADHTRLHGRKEVMPTEEPAVDILTAGFP